jgi:hypothetical protein
MDHARRARTRRALESRSDVPDAANVAVFRDGGANAMARRIRCAVRMQHLTGAEARQDDVRQSSESVLPLSRCRELLGDEAAGVSDEELDRVRRHADALAHALIEIAVERQSQG